MVALVATVVPQMRADAAAEAEALLARAQATYADTAGLEAVAIVRELRVVPNRPGGPGAAPRVMSTVYQRVVLTKGSPDNWRIISQR